MNRATNPIPDVNTLTPDFESDITGYGAHNRLLVFGELDGQTFTVREDLQGLPRSTETQRRKVLNSWQRLHKRGVQLDYVSTSEPWRSGAGSWESIEHVYAARMDGGAR